MLLCLCVENKCESKNLYKSKNLDDCEKLPDYPKEECIGMISYNINRANK